MICPDSDECEEVKLAAIDDWEARWFLSRNALTVVRTLAIRQLGFDPIDDLHRGAPREAALLDPYLFFHHRYRGVTIVDRLDLHVPMCEAARTWIDVERDALLGYFLVERARRKRATLVDLLWGEEIEVMTGRSIHAIEGRAFFGRVHRYEGRDSFAGSWTDTLSEEEARCAALEARAGAAGPGAKVLLSTWESYCARSWPSAVLQ